MQQSIVIMCLAEGALNSTTTTITTTTTESPPIQPPITKTQIAVGIVVLIAALGLSALIAYLIVRNHRWVML